MATEEEQRMTPPSTRSMMSSPLLYMAATFFICMIGHELALEAATAEFSELESLAFAVTLFQFGFCVVLPLLVSRGRALEKFPTSVTGFIPYLRLSIVVFGATALASQSLRYVTYPTKVVFKSAKLIPTMMVATCLQGKRYGMLEYTAALLLCTGAAGYTFGRNGGGGPDATSTPGILLLTISIFCDALVPNFQQILMSPPEKSTDMDNVLQDDSRNDPSLSNGMMALNGATSVKTRGSGVSAAELMVNVNAVGFSGLLFYMLSSGQLSSVVSTAAMHPRLVMYLTLVGLGLSTSVLAYTRLIQSSGSVVAVAVATLRKVVTVVLSYIVFPKPILAIHVVSGLLVLGGIVLSTVAKQHTHRRLDDNQQQ